MNQIVAFYSVGVQSFTQFFRIVLNSYIYFSDNAQTVTISEGIIPIEQEVTTAYLIKIPSGYLLFDTGYEKDFDTFKEILIKEKIDLNSIIYLLLSHHHDDHVGFIAELTERNPSLKIIVHEKTVPLLATGKNNKMNGGGIVNSTIFLLFRIKQLLTPDWTLTFPPFNIRSQDIIIQGEVQPLPAEVGIEGVIVHTPGHSSDSISLLYKNKYLLCGDMASYFLNWAGAKHLTLFNENINEVYKSWEKVISMDVKYVIPSHGKPFRIERLKNNLYKYTQKDLVKFF